MKKLSLCFALLVTVALSFAQKKTIGLEDAMLRARTMLGPQTLPQLQFLYGTGDYVYLKPSDGKGFWMKGNFKAKEETPFLTLEMLNEKLKNAGKKTLEQMPAIRFNDAAGWVFVQEGNKVALNPATGQITTLLDSKLATMENAEESRAGHVAYLKDYNLYISANGKEEKITDDGSADIVYASSVHRDEFGISKGTFWNNKGDALAFYRMDQSMVNDYPIINWSKTPAVNENIKYPMAGGKSHQVALGVYNVNTGSLIYVKTGEPAEQYLTNVAWSPDDKYIYIAVLNRAQNYMRLNQYDAATGGFIRTLFEEQDEKYTEPLHPMQFLPNNPTQFIWQSFRNGWNHLYLYDINGKLLKQLTNGNWDVTEVKGFDAKAENLYFVSTQQSPLNRDLFQLNLKKGTVKQLTTAAGVHNTQVSTDGQYLIDNYSNVSTPRVIQLTEVKTGKTKTLFQAADPLKDYAVPEMSLFTIKNRNGDSLFCKMVKPLNFDATKKYPVIVYWYGGPHVQLIQNNWNGGSGDYWYQYMASRGYLVFSLDTRGSANRGRTFEQSIFRNIGQMQLEDLDAGVNYLAGLSFADTAHMGLFGWSFGGFLTTNYMLNRPGVFKAAVAGGPVLDWKMYEIMYGERYMDTPAENAEGYEKNNLIKQAGKLKGKLLMIHGLQDPVVVQQHSVNFVKACIDKGVQIDYMIYPGYEHNVTGKDRAHLYRKVSDYLETNIR